MYNYAKAITRSPEASNNAYVEEGSTFDYKIESQDMVQTKQGDTFYSENNLAVQQYSEYNTTGRDCYDGLRFYR